MRTPSSAFAPNSYVPEAGGVSRPAQRAENPSYGSPGAGGSVNQLKLSRASLRLTAGSPFSSTLAKYSALKPGAPSSVVKADAWMGMSASPVRDVPMAWSTSVPGETFCLMPSTAVTNFEGMPW